MSDKSFDLSEMDAGIQETADMQVVLGGRPFDWTWTFAGPGHPRTESQQNRISRETLRESRAKEQAQVNGKKWKAEERSPDDVRDRNITFVLERLVGWSAVTFNGDPFPFSEDNARKILSAPKNAGLLQQAIEFILEDSSFIQRSATN